MSAAAKPVAKTMDPSLLARMTGRLGDGKSIEAVAADLAAALTKPLRTSLGRALSMPVSVTPGPLDAGAEGEVVAAYGDNAVLCPATIPGWPKDALIVMDTSFVIAATERLLGGTGDYGDEASRPLSEIERDIAAVMFEAIAVSIQRTVAPDDEDAVCKKIVDGPFPQKAVDLDGYACALAMTVALEGETFPIAIIAAQSVLLKMPEPASDTDDPEKAGGASQQPEWAEQLTRKVHTSHVRLEANVALAPVKLSVASRIQAGDVLPFADESDVRVLLKANGKDLYWCEFGKSGQRYMLRVQERFGSEEDFIRQLSA